MATATWELLASARLFRCDPYLVWSEAVSSPGESDELDISVLVELKAPADYEAFFQRMNPQGGDLDHFNFLPNGFEPHAGSRFITGLVNRAGLSALVDQVAPVDPLAERSIERFSLQNSRQEIAQSAKAMWRLAISSQQLEQALAKVGAAPGPHPAAPGGSGVYLGIIDDGLPFLRVRDSVRRAGQPAHLWDQGWRQATLAGTLVRPGDPPAADDPYWRIACEFRADPARAGMFLMRDFRGFLYGRRLRELPAQEQARGRNDRDEYFLGRYFAPPPRHTHGASVLGLLAPWLSGARGPVEWPDHVSGLAMVQLPTNTVLDTSGGSLAARVIDGLRYILWQEFQDRTDKDEKRPVVVNISYGVHAGPHDGTSMFERALAEMLEAHDNLHVVLPIGNAAQAGCHARRVLGPQGGQHARATIALEVLPDNGRDTFVEFWLPRGSKVALRIRPPGFDEEFAIHEGETRILFGADTPRTVHFGAVYSAEVAQGTNRAMALLAIGPTRRLPRASCGRSLNQQQRQEVLGMPGLWRLTLENLTDDEVTADAWIERDDAPPDAPVGRRQAYFPDSGCEEVGIGNATPDNTASGIATLKHPRLHVVGAMRRDGGLSAYTAAGAEGGEVFRQAPDVVATADWSRSLPGLRTMGFVRGAIARINGTSAACAVYTRALARQLGRNPSVPCDAPIPGSPPPEITGATNSPPHADPLLRGEDKRRVFPFDVEL